jgi:hypothetical protein
MSRNVVRGTEHEEDCCKVWLRLLQNEQSAGNFNNSFKWIQIFFGMLSLSPSDYFIFPKIKIKLNGRRFDTSGEIQAETQAVLNTVKRKHLQDGYQKW